MKKSLVLGLVVVLGLTALVAAPASAVNPTAPVTPAISVGASPDSIAFTPDGKTAFVSNYDGSTVSVINVASNAQTALLSMPGGSAPSWVAVSPDGKYVAAVSGDAQYVAVFSATSPFAPVTYNGKAFIALDATPIGVAFGDNATAYTANTNGTVTKVDITPGTGSQLAEENTGYGNTLYQIMIKGTTAYVSDEADSLVFTIDLTTFTGGAVIANSISGFTDPDGMASNPAGTMVYVADYGDGYIHEINVASSTMVKSLYIGGKPINVAFTPDGKYAYVSNYGNSTVSVIDTSAQTVSPLTMATTLNHPWAIEVSPLGNTVYVANSGANNVAVLGIAPVFTAYTPSSSGSVGTAYSYTYAATGTPAAQFALSSGAFPTGLSLNATTGVLSGTPTATGPFTFTVTATGASPAAVTPSTTITVTSFSAAVASAEMGAVHYSTSAQTSTGTLSLSAANAGSTGWNVTILASDFLYSDTNGNAGVNIPASSFLLTGVGTPTRVSGQAVTAGGTDASVTGPQQASMSSGVIGTLASTRTILHAGANYGAGSYTQALAVSLTVPASSVIGLYTSTLTVTIASGP